MTDTPQREPAVTMEQVIAALSNPEPDYVQAAVLGPGALPFLADLVMDTESGLGPAAAYFAGLVGTQAAVLVLDVALRSEDAELRRAAARGVARIDPVHRPSLLVVALRDDDPEVLRIALDAVSDSARRDVLSHVIRISGRSDLPADVRGLAERTLGRQRGPEPPPTKGGARMHDRLGKAGKKMKGRFRKKRK